MMGKSSKIGRNHVLLVGRALNQLFVGQSIESFPETVVQTVKFICKKYPTIESAVSKYEREHPDLHPDLQLTLSNDEEVNVNLFKIKGSAAIQPKNLGARSFLETYFCSKGLQIYFTDYLDESYTHFLREVISLKEKPNDYDQIPALKKKVNAYYPKFTPEINPLRTSFLFDLREYCFELLQGEFNIGARGIQHAFNELMMLEDTTIITRYADGDKCLSVAFWKSEIDSEKGIEIYKKGNDTIGIRSGDEALTIRFKFESSPTSSMKLATSYQRFPSHNQIEKENRQSVAKFERLLQKHVEKKKQRGRPDAIGKCNEAMVYYRIVKENPAIDQIQKKEYQELLVNHYSKLTPKELASIQLASKVTTQKMYTYLADKYGQFHIESIQLVTQSYLKDRSDTSDLQLILKVNRKSITASFSLKAIARRNTKITSKNPGARQLLGPTYFDIGSLGLVIDETEKRFKKGELNHRQSMEIVSAEIGKALLHAPGENLKKGVRALLGNQPMVVTIYLENDSLVLEYDAIQEEVIVQPNTPSTIQTTLTWNTGQEELSLRVKFSRSQAYGWSSLKLACDYRVEYG